MSNTLRNTALVKRPRSLDIVNTAPVEVIKKELKVIRQAIGLGRVYKRRRDKIARNPFYGFCRHFKPRVAKGAFGKSKFLKVRQLEALEESKDDSI